MQRSWLHQGRHSALANSTLSMQRCEFAGCTNPAHMRLGTNATYKAGYFSRRNNLSSPLADVRGGAGRTRAIAAANRLKTARRPGQHRETDPCRRNGWTSADTLVRPDADMSTVSAAARHMVVLVPRHCISFVACGGLRPVPRLVWLGQRRVRRRTRRSAIVGRHLRQNRTQRPLPAPRRSLRRSA